MIVNDGESALTAVEGFDPNLILLDLMLPGIDGYQVCREVRAKHQTPIIMLSAKGEIFDKVLGLELGADDYMTKPFGIRELIARVKANLRRTEIESQSEQQEAQDEMKIGDLVINFTSYEVSKDNKVIDLTLREFELLKFLANYSGQVFSREALLEKVWGYEYYGDMRTVDVTVRRLREKVEDDSAEPTYIMTKRGVGYYFKK